MQNHIRKAVTVLLSLVVLLTVLFFAWWQRHPWCYAITIAGLVLGWLFIIGRRPINRTRDFFRQHPFPIAHSREEPTKQGGAQNARTL